jgi:anion transporter
MSKRTAFSLLGVATILMVSAYAPLDLTGNDRIVIALALTAAMLWTLEPVPIEWTALALLFALPALGIITFEQTFAAFGGKAIWLVIAGSVLSSLITETGLAGRLSSWIAGRATRGGFIIVLHLMGVLLAVLIPSGVVRVLIIMPVLVRLLEELGEPPGSKTSAAVILSVVCATYYGGTGILTASVPNLVVMGVLESRGTPVYWATWALHMFPVIGLVRVAIGAALVYLLFHPRFSHDRVAQTRAIEPIGGRERMALLLLAIAIGLWSTDIFHGIHPALVGLGVAVCCFLPRVGPLDIDILRKVNFPILVYIGSVFAIGEAMAAVGTSGRIAHALAGAIDLSGQASAQLTAITWAVAPFNFLVDTAVVGGVLTPALLDLGAGAGLTALQVGLSVAVGTGLVFIPYQGAPFILAYSFQAVRMGQFIVLMFLICVINLLLLVPLNLAYWHWLGLF